MTASKTPPRPRGRPTIQSPLSEVAHVRLSRAEAQLLARLAKRRKSSPSALLRAGLKKISEDA